ncbi:MAG: histidine kinase [Candidatus Methanomethylicota archaeon]|jgi:energy-coupling factor transport system substrate-specific component|uniref:Histidine kinase n=1 Tax=Thermoproteota archaeon TaxID=2056631 RepID=A0A520KGM6_9CREN|nr:MAG: histidine kinase [Candidatus Verstraetearchaeota archaeon]TDA39647.1 MAG: histidine kinase [Candidatus Verstraetearchaeota archaeon]
MSLKAETKTEAKLKRPDALTAIAYAAITSAVTGVGFLLTAPIPLIPGAIHWRVLAFLPCIFGVMYGPIIGFISGAIGNTLWAVLGGYFNPATPIFDLIGVGITGLLPGLLTKPNDALSKTGLIKIAVISFIAGIIMVPIVAIGFDWVGVAPFIPAVILLSLSDLLPILIGTPIVVRAIVPVLMKRGLIRWRL